MLVPAKRTTPTILDFAKAIIATHAGLTKEAAGVLYAQFAAETGDGKYCYGYNLGNVKWTQGSGYDAQALVGTWECLTIEQADALIEKGLATLDPNDSHQSAAGVGKKAVVLSSDNPATWFVAYPDLATGMRNFVTMKQAGRYASAWPFVLAGDVDGFAAALHAKGYFTASVESYAKLMRGKLAAWTQSDAWAKALAETAPASHEPTHPIELAQDGVQAVDPSGVVSELFEIVHAELDMPERTPPEV